MTSQQAQRVRSLRRWLVAGSVAAATVSVVALPLAAQAAPTRTMSAIARDQVDPVAGEAATALATLRRATSIHDAAAMQVYEATRDRIAEVIAARAEVDPLRLKAAWQRADRDHQEALLAALSQLGVPYRHNASKPGEGFDCSGLTTYAWSEAGFLLQRQSSAQIRAAAPRDESTAQAGDLVQYPGHVMMWLGVDRAIVHAPYTGRDVEVDQWSSRRRVRFGDPTD
jgi:cell wall-associated NlpC family hydrolase